MRSFRALLDHLATLTRRQGPTVVRRSGIARQAKALRKVGVLDGPQCRETCRLARLGDRCRKAKGPAPSRKQVRRLIARAREMVRETL